MESYQVARTCSDLHHFNTLVVRNILTISFIFDSPDRAETEFPKYILETADGEYQKELSPKKHLVRRDQYLQLRFDNLLPGKTYTLTRFYSNTYQEVIFQDQPFEEIIDQVRPPHRQLAYHDYAEFGIDFDSPVDAEEWNTDQGSTP